MLISLIVAADENNAIGRNNALLWRLPNDLKFFKNTTWGMPVIMGRKTFLSLSGKPLPGRYNIVVSRQSDHGLDLSSGITVVSSTEEAIEKARDTDCREVFIAGGGQIYNAYLPVADKIYITRVRTQLEGDTFFPDFPEEQWKKIYELNFNADERHAYAYSFQTWVRKHKEGH